MVNTACNGCRPMARAHPLRTYLKARRITQSEFAHEAGIHTSRISEILRWRNPSPALAKQVENGTRAADRRGLPGGVVLAAVLLYFWPKRRPAPQEAA
jgi:transcriptional regulator with XRE-family HTH domain